MVFGAVALHLGVVCRAKMGEQKTRLVVQSPFIWAWSAGPQLGHSGPLKAQSPFIWAWSAGGYLQIDEKTSGCSRPLSGRDVKAQHSIRMTSRRRTEFPSSVLCRPTSAPVALHLGVVCRIKSLSSEPRVVAQSPFIWAWSATRMTEDGRRRTEKTAFRLRHVCKAILIERRCAVEPNFRHPSSVLRHPLLSPFI